MLDFFYISNVFHICIWIIFTDSASKSVGKHVVLHEKRITVIGLRVLYSFIYKI